MKDMCRVIRFGILVSLASSIAPAQNIRLAPDQNAQTVLVQTDRDGQVFLALGPLQTPIQIGNIEIDVYPEYLLPLGAFVAHEPQAFFVPRGMHELYFEAVLVDKELALFDSNVLPVLEVFGDLPAATFRAVLVATDSIPPIYTLGAALTAPSSGYDFKLDAVYLENRATHVYLRLLQPSDKDIVLPVLTPVDIAVQLGSDVGDEVRVYMMRQPRGMVVPEVYRLMAVLRVYKA